MLERQKRLDRAKALREQVEQYEYDQVNEVNDAQPLPPRATIHNNKKQKIKVKLSFPLIRALLIMFIILVIAAVTSPYWLD